LRHHFAGESGPVSWLNASERVLVFMQIIGLGQIIMWPGGNLWIGVSRAPVAPHAHHAIQISLALGGTVRLRCPRGNWTEHRAALIPSHLPHAFDATGSKVANVFCEPESDLGRGIRARHSADAVSEIDAPLADQMREMFREEEIEDVDSTDLIDRSVAALRIVAGERPWHNATDPRVLRAIEMMRGRLDEPLRLEDLAEAVCLSPGRFRHLFVAETGLPFRRHLLWLRLQKALEVALEGKSWTAAAHAANFADQAHLTRTFRQMFGVAPSALGHPTPLSEVFDTVKDDAPLSL
jgi:AraC-like DNA-binding protein